MLNLGFYVLASNVFCPQNTTLKAGMTSKIGGSYEKNHEIKIRFNEEEFETLVKKLRKTKLSREAFSRACILGKEIKVPPDLEYYKLKNEFNHIGNNLNQIARTLNNRQEISPKII